MQGRLARYVGGAALAALAGVGFLAACGGDDDDGTTSVRAGADGGGSTTTGPGTTGSGVPSTPTNDACRAYVQAYCDRASECGVTVQNCMTTADLCPDYVFLPGNGKSLDDVTACTATQRQQPCGELVVGITPACTRTGTNAPGQGCNFSSQCASNVCTNLDLAGCGLCATTSTDGGCSTGCLPNIGASCLVCPASQQCINGACTPLVAAKELAQGDACSADGTEGVCTPPLRCRATASGNQNGTCEPAPAAGQPCLYAVAAPADACATGHCGGPLNGAGTCTDTPGAVNTRCRTSADCDAALACLSGTVCVTTVADGAPCGESNIACGRNSYCAREAGQSVCRPRGKVGDACTITAQDSCPDGAGCLPAKNPDGGVPIAICQAPFTHVAPGGACTSSGDCEFHAACNDTHVCALNICQ